MRVRHASLRRETPVKTRSVNGCSCSCQLFFPVFTCGKHAYERAARYGGKPNREPPSRGAALVWFEGVLEGDRRKDVAGGVANEVDWAGRENPLLRRVGEQLARARRSGTNS